MSPLAISIAKPTASAIGSPIGWLHASNPLVFDALAFDPITYEMLGIKTGIGVLTVGSGSVRYVRDNAGVFQAIAAGEIAWAGARYSGGVAYADDGAGNPLAEVPWLSVNPAATNAQIRSNDLADAEWTATNVAVGDQDEIGIDGGSASACTLTATDANGTVIANAIAAASATHATKWYLKRETGTGTIELTLDNGSTWQDITSELDSSFNGIAVDQAALTNPQVGIRIVTDTDAVIVGNAEEYSDRLIAEVRGLPPIFTEGTAASTQADGITASLDNHDNLRGAYFFEWRPGYANQSHSTNQGIVSCRGNPISILYDTVIDGAVATNDSTAVAGKTLTWSADDILKCGVIYDADVGAMRLCVNGDWSSPDPTAYDGDYILGSLINLFYGNDFPNEMRGLQRYDLAYDAAKAKIDELMI